MLLWQHLSKASKRAVFSAQLAARRAGQAEVCPEHLAFAIMSDPLGEVAATFDDLGVDRDECCEAMSRRFAASRGRTPLAPGFSAPVRRTLTVAYFIAKTEHRGVVRPHHLFLAMIVEPTNVAKALASQGVEVKDLQAALMKIDTETDAINPNAQFVATSFWVAFGICALAVFTAWWIGAR
jgi:ATP-dependent Clp protease ATP-binding subunit ClpA